RADPADVFVAADLDRTAGSDARRHAFDRHDAAPGHLLREARGLRAEQAFAYRRVDAVGADDDVGLDRVAIRESRRSDRARRGNSSAKRAGLHTAAKLVAQQSMQVGAVNGEIGRAEPRRAGRLQQLAEAQM